MSARDRAALLNAAGYWSFGFVRLPASLPMVFRAEDFLNLGHPLAALLFRSIAFLATLPEPAYSLKIPVGRLRDAVNECLAIPHARGASARLAEAASEVGLEVDTSVATVEHIIWYGLNPRQLRVEQVQPFGTVLHSSD